MPSSFLPYADLIVLKISGYAYEEWLFRVDRIAEMEEFFFYCTVWGLKVYDHLGILSNNTFLSTTYHGHVVRDPYTLGLCFGNVVDLLNALS